MSQITEKNNINSLIEKVIYKISKHYLESDNVSDLSSHIIYNNGHLKKSENIDDAVLNIILEHIKTILQSEIQKNNSQLNSLNFLSVDTTIQNINYDIDKWIINNCYKGITIQDINELSTLNYESANCSGNIVLLDEENDSITCEVRFCENEYDTSFEFSGKNLKFIRKLLEVTNENLFLVLKHTDKNRWIPVGYSTQHNDYIYPTLSIKGKLHWEFFASTKKVLFSQGKYIISNNKEQLLEDELSKLVKANDKLNFDSLKELINKIKKSKDIHGALFIFIDEFHEEKINDLCKHKFGIKVQDTGKKAITLGTPSNGIEILSNLCKVDGALVFDKNGKLVSVSTILDGCVVKDGDIGRGSRYNSTKTFVDYYTTYKKHTNLKCYGLVISEDGYVNFIEP